eukprot:gene34587-41882_t
MGFGLQNQITLIAKSLLMGSLTQRHVCVGLFLPYFASWPSIPMDMVVNMTETNRALARIEGFNASSTYLSVWTEAAAGACVCYLLQGADGVNLPAGHRKCVGRPWKVLRMHQRDALRWLLHDNHAFNSVCLTPGLPFYQPLDTSHQALLSRIVAAIHYTDVFLALADHIKRSHGVCRPAGCSGQEAFVALHLRLEDDWIKTKVGAMQIDLIFKNRSMPHDHQLYYALIRHKMVAFLNHTLPLFQQALHISPNSSPWLFVASGLKYYASDRYGRYATDWAGLVLPRGQTIASTPLNLSAFLPAHPGDPGLLGDVAITQRFQQLMEHVVTPHPRELLALVDFIVASQAAHLIGVCDSTFTHNLRAAILDRRYGGQEGKHGEKMMFHCFLADVYSIADGYSPQQLTSIRNNYLFLP